MAVDKVTAYLATIPRAWLQKEMDCLHHCYFIFGPMSRVFLNHPHELEPRNKFFGRVLGSPTLDPLFSGFFHHKAEAFQLKERQQDTPMLVQYVSVIAWVFDFRKFITITNVHSLQSSRERLFPAWAFPSKIYKMLNSIGFRVLFEHSFSLANSLIFLPSLVNRRKKKLWGGKLRNVEHWLA